MLREVLAASSVVPDFEYAGQDEKAFLDFIHRSDSASEIYFVANRLARDEVAHCTFRVTGRQPELWDPISGTMHDAAAFSQADDRTTVPLNLAPYGSIFVIFRRPIPRDRQGTAEGNSPKLSEPVELQTAWTVKFAPQWGGPESVRFEKLCDWTKADADGIKYYSGTATYVSEKFACPCLWCATRRLRSSLIWARSRTSPGCG